jgi:acyl carrier protein
MKIVGSELRSFAEETLPDYVVPATFIFLDKIPLTSNGKVDRNALPAPSFSDETAAFTQVVHESPRSEIERTIEQAWNEALGVDHVGLNQNFFDLGAHSLLVAEVHALLQERLGREIPLVDLFHFPCIAALASHLSGEAACRTGSSPDRVQQRLAARRDRVLK